MKKTMLVTFLMFIVCNTYNVNYSFSQTKIEAQHTISKKANKGYLFETSLNENGNIELIYKIKAGKDKTTYEVYEFDKSLKFIQNKEADSHKTRYKTKAEISKKIVYATVGGGSSFDILSTKLHLHFKTIKKVWDVESQKYRVQTIQREDINPKNESNKKFKGNVDYNTADGSLFVLATSDKGKGDKSKTYSLLKIDVEKNMSETEIEFDRQHVLIYSGLMTNNAEESDNVINNEEMFFVFAPETGNLKEYTILQYNIEGKLTQRYIMNVPKNILAITAHNITSDGSLYFCALSTENKKYFTNTIGEYTPIENLSYKKYGTANFAQETFDRNLEKTNFEDFVTIKIKNNKIEWINSTPISDFKKKVQSPPNQKGAWVYDGKSFVVNNFYVTKDEGFIITGQRKVYVFKPEPKNIEWRDVICIRLDNKGNLLAQFSYKPVTDKESKLFPIPQELIPTEDGNNLYWMCYEVKATKGYSSWYNAYSGTMTIVANYFPSLGKINLETNKLDNFSIMGERKFLLPRSNFYVNIPNEKTRVYVGQDKKGKIILTKYNLN
jgi:hypothetical protein